MHSFKFIRIFSNFLRFFWSVPYSLGFSCIFSHFSNFSAFLQEFRRILLYLPAFYRIHIEPLEFSSIFSSFLRFFEIYSVPCVLFQILQGFLELFSDSPGFPRILSVLSYINHIFPLILSDFKDSHRFLRVLSSFLGFSQILPDSLLSCFLNSSGFSPNLSDFDHIPSYTYSRILSDSLYAILSEFTRIPSCSVGVQPDSFVFSSPDLNCDEFFIPNPTEE